MSDMTPEKAQALLDKLTFEVVNGEMDRELAGEVGSFIRAQAAKITRLQAKVDAADKLVEAGELLRMDYRYRWEWDAALTAYKAAGK